MHAPRFALVCVVAMLAGVSVAQQLDTVRGIAAENADLSAQMAADATALDRELAEPASIRGRR